MRRRRRGSGEKGLGLFAAARKSRCLAVCWKKAVAWLAERVCTFRGERALFVSFFILVIARNVYIYVYLGKGALAVLKTAGRIQKIEWSRYLLSFYGSYRYYEFYDLFGNF